MASSNQRFCTEKKTKLDTGKENETKGSFLGTEKPRVALL